MRLLRLPVLLAVTLGSFVTAATTPEPPVCSVTEFGARPDDGVEDTAAIQAAVDSTCAASGGTVWFPRGRYLVGTVDLSPGLTLAGEEGAVLARLPGRGKWDRMLTTERRRWRGEHDSPPLVVRGLTFDGSRKEQGPYAHYELEQQHLLMLNADPAGPGRLVARVEDCVFREGVADGVSIGTNVAATVRRTVARDVFRGGVVLHGGYSTLTLEDFEAGGADHWTGIDVEVSTPGFGDSRRVEVQLERVTLDGDFDVALDQGSRLEASEVRTRFGGFGLYALESEARIRRSSFAIGPRDGNHLIYYPHDVLFEDCAFVAVETASEEADREFALVDVVFETSYLTPSDQVLRLVNTTFAIDESVEAQDTLIAIATAGAANSGRNVRIVVERTSVPAGFDHGVHVKQGGGVVLTDVQLDSATGLFLAASPSFPLDARLERVTFGPHVKVAEDLHASAAGSRVQHVDVVLEAGRNVLATRYGLEQNEYLGSRTILADVPPGQAGGLAGDVWMLRHPSPGAPSSWTCTRSHATRADWSPVPLVQ